MAKQKGKSKRLVTESQSERTAELSSAAVQLKQIADNFENWAKKERAKYIDPNGVKPPAFTLAQIEGWVNTWLLKQRLVAVFFSHPHLCYDKDDFVLFITTERKEFHLIIDFFRLYMPAIATSLKELYDEFWEDVAYHIECFKRSKEVQQRERQGDIPPSALIGESMENIAWEPTLFLDGAVATLIRRLRHIVEMAREELVAEKPPAIGVKAGSKKTRRGQQKKYTPEILKAMQKLFDDESEKQKDKDVKAAWSKVAEVFNIKSGKAAEMAVRRHQKQNK